MSDTTQSSIEDLTVSAPPVADEHTTHAAAPDQRPSKPRTRRGVWWYTWRLFAVVIGWVIVSFAWVYVAGPVPLEVSRETTIITEPLDEMGYVDYVAWLDRDSKVPPERNAAITFLQILGPAMMPEEYGGLSEYDYEEKHDVDPSRYAIVPIGASAPEFPYPTVWSPEFLEHLGTKTIPFGRTMINHGALDTIYEEFGHGSEGDSYYSPEYEDDPIADDVAKRKATSGHVAYFVGRGKLFDANHPLLKQFDSNELAHPCKDQYELSTLPLTAEMLKHSPRIALWLKLNRGVTDSLIGLKGDRWYLPFKKSEDDKGMLTVRLSLISQVRDVAKLAVFESRLDFAEGKSSRGYQRMFGVWRAGRAMEKNRRCLIEYLVGLAVDSLSMQTLSSGIQSGVFSADDLRAIQTAIPTLPPVKTPKEALLYGERFSGLDIIQRFTLFSDGVGDSEGPEALVQFVDFNEMMRMTNALYLRISGLAEAGDDEYEEEYFRNVGERSGTWVAGKITKFVLGTPGMKHQAATELLADKIHSIIMPAVTRCWEMGYQAMARQQMLEVGIAMELYRKQHGGKLPATLNGLLGARAKTLTTPPEGAKIEGAMRLTVIGDTAAPDAYAIWYPRQGYDCLWQWPDEYEPTDEELEAIGNDPAEIELKHCRFDSFILYIPISAKAKAAWTAMEMKKFLQEEEEPEEGLEEEPEGDPEEGLEE